MSGLSRLLADHHGAAEADWRRFYGRSLKHDLWGKESLGAREIISMIRWLPPEAAFWRSAGTSWTTDNELQATTIEMLDALLRTYIQANSKPNAKKPSPMRIPRPWDKAEKKQQRGTSIGEMIGNGLTVKRGPKSSGGGDKWQE
jgi:hypothetical protein